MAVPIVAAAGAKLIGAKAAGAAVAKGAAVKAGATAGAKSAAVKASTVSAGSKAGTITSAPKVKIAGKKTLATPKQYSPLNQKPNIKTKAQLEKYKNQKIQKDLSKERLNENEDLEDYLEKNLSETNQEEEVAKKKDTFVFIFALCVAIIKDAFQIFLNFLVITSLLATIISFPFTLILTTIIFISGKRGMFKMITYLMGIMVNQFAVGINSLPIATIAVILTFRGEKLSASLKKIPLHKISSPMSFIKTIQNKKT